MPQSSSSSKGINMNTTLPSHDIHRLLHAEHDDPFGVLGLHQIDEVWVVRSFRPDAKELAIVDRHGVERRFPATRIAEEGLFEAQLEGLTEAFDYLSEVTTLSGETFQISDPYSYGPILGELDMHLYKVGNHYEIYEKLGAHLTEINGHAGVSFAVWAPNAQRVSVVGDFNGWDGLRLLARPPTPLAPQPLVPRLSACLPQAHALTASPKDAVFPGKASPRRPTRFLRAAFYQSRRFPSSSNPPSVLARRPRSEASGCARPVSGQHPHQFFGISAA
jgi:hypothetical protein